MDTRATAEDRAIERLTAASEPRLPILDPPQTCIVCRDPSGIGCCEFGRSR